MSNIEYRPIKTDFEKLVIAKQYIDYLKKRIQELDEKVYNNELLIEKLKLMVPPGKTEEVIKSKDQFYNRFLRIYVEDENEIKEYIKNEIEPKAIDN